MDVDGRGIAGCLQGLAAARPGPVRGRLPGRDPGRAPADRGALVIPPPPSPLEFFARPRRLPVTGDDWQTAARLGLERVEANNATRTATQTRPMEKQVLQDVLGALAELVVVLACARVGYDHDTTLWDD